MDHKIEPRRLSGRTVICKVCKCDVIWVRPRGRGPIRKPHWRHLTYQQTGTHLALISPNWRP